MSQTSSCIDKEALVDYLYGESDADARRRVDAHLRSCARCADEIGSLTAVRRTIETWEPHGADPGFRLVADPGTPSPARAGWRPAWALAAAAVLAVAAALIVRPEIELGADGMVLRIGWRGGETGAAAEAEGGRPPSDPGAMGRPAADPPPAPTVLGTPVGLGAGGAANPIPVSGSRVGSFPDLLMNEEAWLQQVRELIRESEQRQMSEMERMFREDQTNDAAARQEILEYMRRISARP